MSSKCVIRRIAIHPVDSTIYLFNNWSLVDISAEWHFTVGQVLVFRSTDSRL